MLFGRKWDDVWGARLLNNSILFMCNNTHCTHLHLLGFTSVCVNTCGPAQPACESSFLLVVLLMSRCERCWSHHLEVGSGELGGKHSSHHPLHMTAVTKLVPAEAWDQQESGLKNNISIIEGFFPPRFILVPHDKCWSTAGNKCLICYLSRNFECKMTINIQMFLLLVPKNVICWFQT